MDEKRENNVIAKKLIKRSEEIGNPLPFHFPEANFFVYEFISCFSVQQSLFDRQFFYDDYELDEETLCDEKFDPLKVKYEDLDMHDSQFIGSRLVEMVFYDFLHMFVLHEATMAGIKIADSPNLNIMLESYDEVLQDYITCCFDTINHIFETSDYIQGHILNYSLHRRHY